MSGGERLRGAFPDDRAALIPYLTAGYPTLEGAAEVGEAFVAAGADVLEIGVPFSDPLADGPTIQDTTTKAIENGADLRYCFDLASRFADRVPVVFLLYYNTIFARGTERFLDEAAEAGVSGLVIPDLPVDEMAAFAEACATRGVGLCPLVAPTSSEVRLQEAADLATGFVYCVSVAGVTGVRDALPPKAVALLRSVGTKARVPVALGFGIGSPEAAAEAAREADGVIERGADGAGEWLREVYDAISGVEKAGDGHQKLA